MRLIAVGMFEKCYVLYIFYYGNIIKEKNATKGQDGVFMKITFMGAGSTVFTKNLIGDIMLTPELCECEIALYDIDGKRLDEQTVNGVTSYFALYSIILAITLILISFDGLSFEANISAVVSCINNIGPAFNEVSSNFTAFSPFSKVVLTIAMLLGRLEIYPLLLALSPYTWLKK